MPTFNSRIAALLMVAAMVASAAHSAPSALVLSGGGAKGAYQVGVWKAMTELGIAKDVTAFSGTSVGGINAALFATVRTPETIESFWLESLGGVMVVNSNKVHDVLQEGMDDFSIAVDARNRAVEEGKAKEAKRLGVDVGKLPAEKLKKIKERADRNLWISLSLQGSLEFLKVINDVMAEEGEVEGYVDTENLKELLENILPHEWSADTPTVYVTALEKGEWKLTEFCLNEEPFPRKVAMLRATSAIPVLFSTVEIDGKNYNDGGWTEKGGDNVPGNPILKNHPKIKTVYVVYLNNRKNIGEDREKAAEYKGKRLVEIIPSKSLHGYFGTMNFNAEKARKLIKLGYDDAMKVLKNCP